MLRKIYGCLLITGFFLTPNMAFAITLWDYTKPESYFREASLEGVFSLDDGNRAQARYNVDVDGNYNIVYRSIPFDWKLLTNAKYKAERDSDKDARSEYVYTITADTNFDKYLGDSKFLSYASLGTEFHRKTGVPSSDDPRIKIGTGVGYGRLYDATPLAQAMRIVDDLILYGVIAEKLSDYGYLQLARVIDLKDEFESDYSKHEYKKFWYEAMEDVLRNDGVLREGSLGAIGIVRIEDILENEYLGLGIIRIESILENEYLGRREHGWIIRAGVSYKLTDYEYGKDDDPAIRISFELGIPYSYRLQFNEELIYESVIGNDAEHRISNFMSVNYKVSNRIDWENSWTYEAVIPSKKGEKNRFTNEFTSRFSYYLVSRIWAVTRVTFTHQNDLIKNNGNDDIETGIYLGLEYRLR